MEAANIIKEDDMIKTKVETFVNDIHNNSSITKSLAQKMIQNFEDLSADLSSSISQNLKRSIPSEYHEIIDDCCQINIFENSDTDWKRMRHLKLSKHYIAPQPVMIGEIDDDKKVMDNVVFTKKKCYAQFIALRDVLKQFLELPNVFHEIINYISTESAIKTENKTYTSLFQGKLWDEIIKNYIGKIVIPIYIYYDDFEISNPLSSAAGIYKIGGLYCSIAALPPKFASLLENIFLFQFVYNSDYKKFGAERCFTQVISELKYLAEKGITVSIDGKTSHIFFVLVGVLGDNLAINSLFGLNESFVSHYYCRFCRLPKSDALTLTVEREESLRNLSNYEKDLSSFDKGLKNKCTFNSIPFFHSAVNWTCDIMHDLYLGVCRYDMAKIIKHCIDNKFFTLKHLNNRLKYFDHCQSDRGNKLTSITESHLQNGYLITTAAEMSCLIAYFGILVGDLVPPDNQAWELYSCLFNIVDLVTSTTISNDDLIYLSDLIRCHHEIYIKKFDAHLTAKFHFLTHYPSIIRIMGPPVFQTCSKYEAFHKKSKKYANLITCRINILLTLSRKLQLELSSRFNNREGFTDRIEFGAVLHDNVKNKFNMKIGGDFCEFSFVRVNGALFKPKYAIHLSNDWENKPSFGVIDNIISNKKIIFLILRECSNLGLNDHIKAYHLIFPGTNSQKKMFQLHLKSYVKPIKIHTAPNGLNVISRRDLI